MKSIPILVWVLACALPVPVCRAQNAGTIAAFERLSSVIGGQLHAADGGSSVALAEVERIALADNAEIHVAGRRVRSAEAHVPAANNLDDPQGMYRSWGIPISKPWDYNSAQNMMMIGQALPGPGKRALRIAVAHSDVEAAKDELAVTQVRVRVEVRKAFYDLLRAQDESRIHDQHVGVAQQAIEAARIKYTVGKIPQVEILKAQLALTRLAEHMIRFERDADVARAHLNTLLGRNAGAAISVEGDYGLERVLPEADVLEKLAMQARPDLLEAETMAEKSRREQAVARKTYVPDFNIAAGYMLMPAGSSIRNNYMLEGSMSLPWLNRHKHDTELTEAATRITEQEAELSAMQVAARGQIGEALAQAKAAQRLARVYQDSLRQQAEETLHSSLIAYENDQTSFLDLLDSQMTVVDVDLAWIDALGEFNTRLADLEMATGTPIEMTDQSAAEERK